MQWINTIFCQIHLKHETDMYMYKLIDAYKNPKEKQNYERKTVIKELSKGRIPA